ncbi:MAG TPA: two-component regulator propeller domain-containing protein, partial [Bryobacteraceae bacterium]|nr:two-component regulator propeller domain-containing protein [Bryobacteraceae bacterium]
MTDTLNTVIRTLAATICLIVATVLAVMPARGQQYAFQYFGVEQGLTNLTVKALYQDHTGFIWVVTENGLFRYEGVRFREFAPEQGLPSSVTASIGEAPDKSVLVGNQSGLFRLRGERFEEIRLPAGKKVNGYNSVVQDGNRTWIGTDAGLLEAHSGADGSLTLTPGPQPPDEKLAEAFGIFVGGETLAWGCGTRLCMKGPDGIRVLGPAEGLLNEHVASIIRDRQGAFWVQQNRRLFVRRAGANRFEEADAKLPPTGPGSNPEIDTDGRLLVPTTEGLAIFEGKGLHVAGRTAGVLPPVYSVLQDREGSVWLGLAGRGLARWLGYGEWESFSAQSGLTGEAVYEILPLPGGVVWAGTESGFFKGVRHGGTWIWQQQRQLGSTPVHAVRQTSDGHLWLGTDGSGAGLFDPKSGTVRWYANEDGLNGLSPYSILIDRDGTVWAGTERGIFTMEKGKQRFEQVQAGAKARCWVLLEAPNGDIWAGTGEGLWRRRNGEWKRFSKADGLQSSSVLALAVEPQGNVWIGYRLTGAITRMNAGPDPVTFTNFDPPQGRQANLTYFLNFDSKGNLWAGTNMGVLVRGPNATHWDRYDHRDGLIWDDCDLHSFASEPDGHVWIGTSGGLSRFIRRMEAARVEAPRTVFTSAL